MPDRDVESPKALRLAADYHDGAVRFWRGLGLGFIEPRDTHFEMAWNLRMRAAIAEGVSNARAH